MRPPSGRTPETLALAWTPLPSERDLCGVTTLRREPSVTQDAPVQCRVVSRAWTAVEANPVAIPLVARDTAGRPRSARLYFFRFASLATSGQRTADTLRYWQVDFPSEGDTVGVSVQVDSSTGRTRLFADHDFGRPYHTLLNPAKSRR